MSTLEEEDNRMVLYLDEFGERHEEKSNFIVNISRDVRAGSKSGYLCEVIYHTGEPLGYVSTSVEPTIVYYRICL